MPVYSYRCNDCGHYFEQRQRMTEDPINQCPVCLGQVRRVVNSVGIVFKGSGFYVTDNRGGSRVNGSAPAASSKAESDEKTPSSDSTAKTETTKKSETATAAANS